MKKLLLAILLIGGLSASAQTTDMKITLVKPGPSDKISSGVPFNIEYVITNNGTTPTTLTDSMIVLFILNNTQQLNVPGVSPVFFTNRVLNNNDTIWFKTTLTLTINGTTGPVTVPFCSRMFAQNGNVTIDPDQVNNNSCNNVVLPVSEVAAAIAALRVYPNPANNVLNIDMDYKNAKEIIVMDLSGKLLSTTQMVSNNTQIDLSNIETGIYLYQIIDAEGAIIYTSKFSVSK
ncbi:MAG: T9SS type A sorting domain-containing protein [bacterium]|nr:T9SS type A sorting domain-containing protein [bacterium]